MVRVAESRRPEPRREARDRRAVLLDVRLRRERAPARQGNRHQGPRVCARRRRRPRRRRCAGDRRRRQRGHGRRLRLHRRQAPPQARLARVDLQRRPVPGGARHGCSRSRRRREDRGRRDHDEHVADRFAGLRVQLRGRHLSPEGRALDVVAAVQPPEGRRQRRQLQRHRQPRLRRVRRERRHRQPRRRSAARDRGDVRQPPDQRLQRRRQLGARVAVVHEQAERLRREAARVGTVHPLAQPDGRSEPIPPSRRTVARRAQDDVAAVDGVTAHRRRPRRRREQRGDRPAERGEEGTVRDAGLRVHGARRRAARGCPVCDAAQGASSRCRRAASPPCARTATGTRRAAFPRRRS